MQSFTLMIGLCLGLLALFLVLLPVLFLALLAAIPYRHAALAALQLCSAAWCVTALAVEFFLESLLD